MLTFFSTSVVLSSEHSLWRFSYRRAAVLAMSLSLLMLLWPLGTMAQNSYLQDAPLDPPASVARLNLTEGAVSFAPASADTSAWAAAVRNRPLTSGDRLWTGAHARAELHAGSTAVRMNAQTSLDFLALNDKLIQLRLAQGSTQLRVRTLFDDQQLEVDTPNLAFVITQPGDYRLDVNPANNTTRVVALAGGGVVYGDNGVTLNLGNQQQGSFSGTQLTPAAPGSAVQDSFDAWAAARDQQEDQSVSARYVPREILGYQQLDSYGDWQQDPSYGAVWLPRTMPVDWAPYRDGHWSWIAPWGWTWVDDAPWGFAPFHYGRWAQIERRWAWVPGHLPQRPIYAPALVAFIGGSGDSWNLAIGAGGASRPSVGWFPLAPGEAFRPIYRASPRYIKQVNNNITVNNTVNIYRYQHQPSAVTTLSSDAFAGGQNTPKQQQRLNATVLSQTRVLADRSALPPRPDTRLQPRLAPATALPPAALAVRPVVESRIGRSRGEPLLASPQAPHTERAQKTPHSNPLPVAAPAISRPLATQVMPPAAHLRPVPTAENNPAAAFHNRMPTQHPPALPADQPRPPNALLLPHEAQTRPNPTQPEPKESRPLTDRSPQSSPQAAAERAAMDQSHRARQLQQTEQARQQQLQQNRQSEAQQQRAAQIRQQNEELQAQRAQAQRQQEQARQQAIPRQQSEAQQQQRATQIRQQNEELQAQRAQAQRQQEQARQQSIQHQQNEAQQQQRAAQIRQQNEELQAQRAQAQRQQEQARQQQALQQRKPATPEPQNMQARDAAKEHAPGEVHRKPEP